MNVSNRQRVLLVGAEEETNWDSCRKINENIINLYQMLQHSIKVEILKLKNHYFSSLQFCDDINRIKPDLVVFYDHRLLTHLFLVPLSKVYSDFKKTKFIFYVYGNMLDRIHSWIRTTEIVKGAKVNFFFASKSMLKIFSSFHSKKDLSNFHVLPFPVKDRFFYHLNEKEINNIEKKNTVSFIYIGRLSKHKNIHTLLTEFDSCAPENSTLKLIGSFDDFDYFSHRQAHSYQSHITEIYAKLKRKSDISFLGHLDESEIINYLFQSDVFLTLSDHPGEDFGMAVAEALATGISTITTSWAGLKDFSNFCTKQISIEELNSKNALIAFSNIKKNQQNDRTTQSRNFYKKYGKSNIVKQLANKLEPKKYEGMSKKMIYFFQGGSKDIQNRIKLLHQKCL